MKQELSILIPVFNYDCTHLVAQLCHLTEGIEAEIIVAEDGSSDHRTLAANSRIHNLPRCRYICRKQNVGRAAIRNFLAHESRFKWLLFLDCDMEIPDEQFISRYLENDAQDVIDGGFAVRENKDNGPHNLRYLYEWTEQERHNVYNRRKNPFRSFRTTNFMIRRDIIFAYPFNEKFRHYGYEDVFFGKCLKEQGFTIEHIDNAMILTDLEDNRTFIEKTEESLRTLYEFREELKGYSRLLTFVNGIHISTITKLIRLWHRLFGSLERRNLYSRHPSLKLFRLYKIGYYLNLK